MGINHLSTGAGFLPTTVSLCQASQSLISVDSLCPCEARCILRCSMVPTFTPKKGHMESWMTILVLKQRNLRIMTLVKAPNVI